MNLDVQRIAENLIVALAGGGVAWTLTTLLKLKRDMNSVWNRLRRFEDGFKALDRTNDVQMRVRDK